MSVEVIGPDGKSWIGVTVYDNWAGSTVTVSTATFEVFDAAGVSKQASGNATITNNDSVLVTVSGLVDAVTNLSDGEEYYVQFKITLDDLSVLDDYRHIRVGMKQL